MATRDTFGDWLDQFAYLDARAIAALPQSQRSLELIHRFAQASVEDGVASLFYNHADLVGDVANAFDEFSETNIADKIRAISRIAQAGCGGQSCALAVHHYPAMYERNNHSGGRAAG